MSPFGIFGNTILAAVWWNALGWSFHSRLRGRVAAGFIVIAAALGGSQGLTAQQAIRPIDLAVVIGGIRFGGIDPEQAGDAERRTPAMPMDIWNETFLGLRFGYNLSNRLAIEAELVAMPKYRHGPAVGDDFQFRGRGKGQASVGVKTGWRGRVVGVFGKARIGIIRFARFPSIVDIVETPGTRIVVTVDNEGASWPLFEGGAVLETYPSSRLVVRADVGDTIVWYRPAPRELNPEYVRHNLHGAVSLGIRF